MHIIDGRKIINLTLGLALPGQADAQFAILLTSFRQKPFWQFHVA
jgi:hypothetical protein